jgi:hypothetical protein
LKITACDAAAAGKAFNEEARLVLHSTKQFTRLSLQTRPGEPGHKDRRAAYTTEEICLVSTAAKKIARSDVDLPLGIRCPNEHGLTKIRRNGQVGCRR